ncbi:hypothetical protein TrRE_jg8209 [Triparma retinervis]|uniref:Uncharacterized protein n=1 Tax=Triparma retinervis TaxID=2557542 RepID=A0A9W7E1L9_9STRA|nr:hypothetical protein TrRE_jg8209 [Triparma retinervis]
MRKVTSLYAENEDETEGSSTRRRRRRRKDPPAKDSPAKDPSAEDPPASIVPDETITKAEERRIVDSLPDFKLAGELSSPSSSDVVGSGGTGSLNSSPVAPPPGSEPPPYASPEFEEIGSSGISRDRRLESSFSFDAVDEPLPKAKGILVDKRRRKGRRGKRAISDLAGVGF